MAQKELPDKANVSLWVPRNLIFERRVTRLLLVNDIWVKLSRDCQSGVESVASTSCQRFTLASCRRLGRERRATVLDRDTSRDSGVKIGSGSWVDSWSVLGFVVKFLISLFTFALSIRTAARSMV
jgi:hypothetical protein